MKNKKNNFLRLSKNNNKNRSCSDYNLTNFGKCTALMITRTDALTAAQNIIN
jgi:hypothetical protein